MADSTELWTRVQRLESESDAHRRDIERHERADADNRLTRLETRQEEQGNQIAENKRLLGWLIVGGTIGGVIGNMLGRVVGG